MATYQKWKHEQTPQIVNNPEEQLNASNTPSETTWAAAQEAASRADSPSDFVNILFNLVKATSQKSNPSATGASQSVPEDATDTNEFPAEVSDSASEDQLPPAPLHSTPKDSNSDIDATPIILSQWDPEPLAFTSSVFSLIESENDHIAMIEKFEILHSQSTPGKNPALCKLSIFTNAPQDDQINLANQNGTYAQISKTDIDDITIDNSIITISCQNGSFHTFNHYCSHKAHKLHQEIKRILKFV